MLKKLTSLLILCLLITGYAMVKPGLDRYVDKRSLENNFRVFPSPAAARLLSAGYREFLSDFYWIEAVNYFGNQIARNSEDYSQLKPFVGIISALDPYFAYFYDWAATAYIYNPSPLTRNDLIESQVIANRGIKELYKIGRIDSALTLKAAFNYALEINLAEPSYDYFKFLGRSSRENRDYLMVAASYAARTNDVQVAKQLFEEFFSYKVFEVKDQAELNQVLAIVSSPAFNTGASEFLTNLRLMNEANNEVKNLIKNRYEANPVLNRNSSSENFELGSASIQRLLSVDVSKNWLPPKLHLLLML